MESVTVLEAGAIRQHVKGIAAEIRNEHAGKRLLLVPVLNAAYILAADVSRFLSDLDPSILFVWAKAYSSDRHPQMGITANFLGWQTYNNIEAAVILDVVCDSGRTIAAVGRLLHDRAPRAIISAHTLVVKPDKVRYKIPFPVYSRVSLQGDPWLVGFGLDSNGTHRALPVIEEVQYVKDPGTV